MAFKIFFVAVLVIFGVFSDNVRASRNLAAETIGITSRLEGDGSASYWDCWNALMEIRSCSNEIIAFFLNGKSDIGEPCCKSISTITHNCWPNMLSSLGFTAAEGNMLSGFCDKGVVPSVAPVAAPPLSLDLIDSDFVGNAT